MLKRITPGGRLSILLALVWSVAVFEFIRGHGSLAECIVGMMGDIVDQRLTMRGPPPTLENVMTTYLQMIPIFFLLGYGITGICRLFRWIGRSLPSSE